MMRLLLLYPELAQGIGGIQVYNRYLLRVLRDLGHQVEVLTIDDAAWNGSIRHHRKAVFTGKFIVSLVVFKPDLLVCGHINFAALALLAKRMFRLPYVTLTYGIDVATLAGLKKQALERSNAVVCISNHTKNTLLRQDLHDVTTILIPNTYDPERFEPRMRPGYLAERWKIADHEIVFLTVARMKKNERYKGYDRVLLALKEVIRRVPGAKYILAGEGDDLPRVQSLVEQTGLGDRVVLPGFIPDSELPDYYNLADVFIMPSTNEGFGFVFLEAIASGKPVIAGNRDGSVDALCNGKLGLLVDPENTIEIADAMIRFATGQVEPHLLDPAFLTEQARREFGLDRFRERVGKLLRHLNQVS